MIIVKKINKVLVLTPFMIIYTLLPLLCQAQKSLSGVTIPQYYNSGSAKLVLNGAGIREKYFIDLYVCGLYLEDKSSDPEQVIESNKNLAIKIAIVSDLISESKMKESIEEGFKKSTKENISAYQERINQFVKAISEDIQKGVVYDLVFHPESGGVTQVYKNNVLKTEVKGLDFKKVLCGIWLGNDPVDKDLKTGLLGKD